MVYSRRQRLPTVPQKARPVVTPIATRRPLAARASRMATAAWTPLAGSSSWARGGSPSAATRVVPFSSTLSLLMLPS